ncbi:MAG: hypothetical protein ACE5GD_02815 [Candidatus Geothermarchaeales archaeon]
MNVEKDIENAVREIAREVIPGWEEYASIQCFCWVIEQEQEEDYKVIMAVDAEHADRKEVYANALFEYNAENGEYVVEEGGLHRQRPMMTKRRP